MISRTVASRTVASRWPTSVSASVVGVLACVAAALALSATPALATEPPECPIESGETAEHRQLREQTEQRRGESSVNPVTHKPYSTVLPDCRAYEMVSPPYKQANAAVPIGMYDGVSGFPVAPSGAAAGFGSGGAFSDPENYRINIAPSNIYLSQRGPSGWTTRSAFAPRNLVDDAFANGLDGDSSPDLRSVRVGCGDNPAVGGESSGQSYVCASHKEAQPLPEEWEPAPVWEATPNYTNLGDRSTSFGEAYMGGSQDLSRVFLMPEYTLLGQDIEASTHGAGIYEIAGVGKAPYLRLVNVDNNGNALVKEDGFGAFSEPPLLGDHRPDPAFKGSDYHAISASGETVFFTAAPAEIQTVYARVHCVAGETEHPLCKGDGNNESFETVAVSNPTHAECEVCAAPIAVANVTTTSSSNTVKVTSGGFPGVTVGMSVSGPGVLEGTTVVSLVGNSLTLSREATASASVTLTFAALHDATFVGASADGSKVFFMSQQKLLSEEEEAEGKGTTLNLYEYNFKNPAGHKLVLLSRDKAGAKVAGVMRTSADGSHVYFVAQAVLTEEPNGNNEKAQSAGESLYGYDTVTNELKFVAPTGAENDSVEEGEVPNLGHNAQTTPDGRYLVFAAASVLAGDTNTKVPTARAVYRYDFETKELTWVSHAAPGFTATPGGEGQSAWVDALPSSAVGAYSNIDDWNRAISGESEAEAPGKTPEQRHDGEYIVFTTTEKLQASDVQKGTEVYEWHCPSPCGHPATEGTVSTISTGTDSEGAFKEGSGAGLAAMSASGSDIFFFTGLPLVATDVDQYRDLYDARVYGGFRKPPAEPPCPPESEGGCQGKTSTKPSFGSASSSVFTAGGNLPPAKGEVLPKLEIKVASKPTRAQQLAAALKVCKGKPRKRRATCELQARKKYGAKAKAKKSQRRGK